MTGTMRDLPAALRAAGLRVWVAPDWLSNGHEGHHELDASALWGGVLHHTAGMGLHAVYGEPDARPDVPQPRCNLWVPRGPSWTAPSGGVADVAVCCAGLAWQAGTGSSVAYADMKAGRGSVKLADAAARGLADDIDAMTTSLHTIGVEIEAMGNGDPADYPPGQLDVIRKIMDAAVDLFPTFVGVGNWLHHRQCTKRKVDMSYRGDIWARTAPAPEEPATMFELCKDANGNSWMFAPGVARQITDPNDWNALKGSPLCVSDNRTISVDGRNRYVRLFKGTPEAPASDPTGATA
jgi:hypothetical protein